MVINRIRVGWSNIFKLLMDHNQLIDRYITFKRVIIFYIATSQM